MSELRAQFDRLAVEWEAHLDASRASSNPYRYVDHPAFDGIVALGETVVPFIIERYRTGSVFWGAALRRITGLSTFGDGVLGDLEGARRGWLAWWDAQAAARV